MNNWRPSFIVFTLIASAAIIGTAFQNCAKNPNLSGSGQSQNSSASSSSQSNSSGSGQAKSVVTIYQPSTYQFSAAPGGTFNLTYT